MFSMAQSRRKKLGDECLSINLKETQKKQKTQRAFQNISLQLAQLSATRIFHLAWPAATNVSAPS